MPAMRLRKREARLRGSVRGKLSTNPQVFHSLLTTACVTLLENTALGISLVSAEGNLGLRGFSHLQSKPLISSLLHLCAELSRTVWEVVDGVRTENRKS